MSRDALKNHPLTRVLHYLYLVPFLPALQPLLVNFRTADMIIYLSGIVLVTFLVIYGNQRPLVRIGEEGLSLYLHYRHNADIHPWAGITAYRRLTPTRISIISRDHHPVKLRLKSADIDILISRLNEEGIHAATD